MTSHDLDFLLRGLEKYHKLIKIYGLGINGRRDFQFLVDKNFLESVFDWQKQFDFMRDTYYNKKEELYFNDLGLFDELEQLEFDEPDFDQLDPFMD